MIPLNDELEALELYLQLEQVRFDNKFSYSINCAHEIDHDFIAIPPMLIQPFIENAILHGIMNKEGRGHISLNLQQKNNTLICTIEDDGIGREASNKIRQNSGLRHNPKGMLITDQRLQLLNSLHNEDVFVEIIDLHDTKGGPCGTKVVISTVFEEI
jgi:sensor histidine kinase YesM